MSSPSHLRSFDAHKVWPFLEGAFLFCLLAFVFLLGGETIRASYHGLMHSTIGETVARSGFLPENPYHAGVPLRYYTFYPWLGVQIGKLLGGSLWGFAFLNMLAALFFAPALDSLGRAVGLSFSARRFSFWSALLFFNGLGWIGFLISSADPPVGTPPVVALSSMAFSDSPWAWDARLQSFLPKFLNASSYAVSLPFALSACAAALTPARRPVEVAAPFSFALALNPLVGFYTALLVGFWKLHTLLKGSLKQRLTWPFAGLLAVLGAGLSLLPLLQPAPTGESLTGGFAGTGGAAFLLLGPAFCFLPFAFLGWSVLAKAERGALSFALLLAAALSFISLPWANEYKMVRLFALFLAIPAGAGLARLWGAGGALRAIPVLALAVCTPTFFITIQSYLAWGQAGPPLPVETVEGQFVPRTLSRATFPAEIRLAEQEAHPLAVLLMHPAHPGTQSKGTVAQGNAFASFLHRPLFVDHPQIHNDRQPDLAKRLELASQVWNPDSELAQSAFMQIREMIPQRPLLVLAHEKAPLVFLKGELGNSEYGEQLLASEQGWQLILFP